MAASTIVKGLSQLLARNVGARIPTRLTESFPSNMGTGPQSFNQPLKLREFAAKQIEQLGPEDAAKIIGEGEEGLPSLLYHITKAESDKPFKKFKWRQQGEAAEKARTEGLQVQPGGFGISDYGDFLSTTLNPHSPFITSYGIHDKSRTLIGLGKVNKLFDFTNKKHVDSIIKPLEKKDLKHLEKSFPKYKKKLEKDLKDFRKKMLDRNIINLERGRGVTPEELEPFIRDQENFLRKQIKELNLDKKKKEIQDRWKRARNEIEVGGWKAIENEHIKDQMRKLGYDAFTTHEGGTNVMLFNPNEQFIPLFDPLKKKSVGFSTGGGLSNLNEKV